MKHWKLLLLIAAGFAAFWAGNAVMAAVGDYPNEYADIIVTAPSATTSAGLRIGHGTAPTSPTNGDVWTTTGGFYSRINGTTQGPYIYGDVALGTGTSGNYVASVQTGTGLTGGAAGSEGAALTLSLSHLGIQNLADPNVDDMMYWDDSDGAVNWLIPYSQMFTITAADYLTLTFHAASGDSSLAANEGAFAVNGLIFEGSSADTIETRFQVTNPTGTDKTITVPNMSGTMKLRTIYWLPGPNAWTLTDPGADSIGAITVDGTPYIPFDKDDEVVWFGPIPSDFDGSVETIQLTWMIPNATEAITWSVSCTVLGESDADNTAEATPVSFASATPDLANDHDLITVSSSAILGAATNAGKNVRVIVKATAAGAFTNEPRLIGLTMEY